MCSNFRSLCKWLTHFIFFVRKIHFNENKYILKFNFILFRIYHSNTNVLVIFWLQIAALMFIRNMFIKWKNCALVPILLPRHPLLPMFRLSPRKVTRKAWCLVLPESSRKENYPVGNRRLRQQPHRRPRWPPTTGLKVSFWCIHTRTYVRTCTYTSYSLLLIWYLSKMPPSTRFPLWSSDWLFIGLFYIVDIVYLVNVVVGKN